MPSSSNRDVVRLHVPVYEPATMRVVERPGDGRRHRLRLLRRYPRWVYSDARLQVPARHQRHGVEVLARALAELVHGDDVGVGEPCCRPYLLLEALDPLGVAGELGGHHLEGDLATEALVLGVVHVGHAAAAQAADDAVMPEARVDLQSHRGSLGAVATSRTPCPGADSGRRSRVVAVVSPLGFTLPDP